MVDNDCVIARDYSPEIKKYCRDNNLSADNLFSSCCCYNNAKGRLLILGEGDPERGKLGLRDNVPLPVTLEIYLENGKLRFVQTEHTYKLLADEPAAPFAIEREPARIAAMA